MSDNEIANPNPTSRLDKRQGRPSRREILGGTCTLDERSKVLASFEQAGFKTISDGVRAVCLAHADSASVRDAVANWRRSNPES